MYDPLPEQCPLANFYVYHNKRGFLQGFDNKSGTPCQFFTLKGENGTVQRGVEEIDLDLENEMG